MTAVRPSTRRRQLFAGEDTVPCCFCGIDLTPDEATLEHIIPVSKGGTLRRSNCTISCFPCNELRGNIDFEEFMNATANLRSQDASDSLLVGKICLGKREKKSAKMKEQLPGKVWTFESTTGNYEWKKKELARASSQKISKKQRAKKRRLRKEEKYLKAKAIRSSNIAPKALGWWSITPSESNQLKTAFT